MNTIFFPARDMPDLELLPRLAEAWVERAGMVGVCRWVGCKVGVGGWVARWVGVGGRWVLAAGGMEVEL